MNTEQYTKKQSLVDWHRADIVAALHKKGMSLRKLSTTHGYSPITAAQALLRPYPKMEWLIADFLGLHPMVIWPSRYDADGFPNRGKKRVGNKKTGKQ